MSLISDIKQDIIDRYNMSWDDQEDNMGLIEAAKQNFKERIELLIKTIVDHYEEKT